MRFTRIAVRSFGPLKDFEAGRDARLPGLVAVLGPNEAGKSTLHAALVALLHGFYPARRDTHPLAPWDEAVPELRAEIILEGGRTLELQRRLLSRPDATLTEGERVEDLANRALPFVRHLPHALFRELYAITLGELAGLEAEGWEAVEDRLVTGLGSSDLRPPREAVSELEKAAAQLWRSDRRSKPRSRELEEAIRKLRQARREALEGDRRLRDRHRRAGELGEALEALARDREALEEGLRRVRRREVLSERAREHETRITELEDAVAELAEEAGELDPATLELLAVEARLRPLLDRAPLVRERALRVEALEREVAGARTRLASEASSLLDLSPDASPEGPLADVPVTAFRDALDRLERARARQDELRERLEELAGEPAPAPPEPELRPRLLALAGGVLLAGGLLLLVAGHATPAALLLLAGALLGAFGGAGLGRARGVADAAHREIELRRRRTEELRGRLAEAEAGVRQARDTLAESLAGLPLRAGQLDDPRPVVLRELLPLRERALELRRLGEELGGLEAARTEVARELGGVVAGCETLADLPPDPIEALPEAGRRLERARERRKAAEAAKGPLERARRELEGARGELARLRDEAAALAGTGDEPGPDDPDPGAWTEAELERRLAAAVEREGALRQELGGVQAELHTLEAQETADLIDGRIEALREELGEVERERDRLFVLARLIGTAEHRFREAHQPDLLLRASGYLSAITGGRYTRFLLRQGAGDESPIALEGEHLPRALPPGEPLSTGTLEQLYLALRLAMVDHLDEGNEPLPLILDEVLVNWDPERRARGLDLLRGVAEHRQVFLFTCHPTLAREAEARGAALLELPGPG